MSDRVAVNVTADDVRRGLRLAFDRRSASVAVDLASQVLVSAI